MTRVRADGTPPAGLDSLIGDALAPRLRALGFRRSRRVFARREPGGWISGEFARSSFDRAVYTVWVGAMPDCLLPSPDGSSTPSQIWRGTLFIWPLSTFRSSPTGQEWWPMDRASTVDVLQAIEGALPQLQALATAQGMRDRLLADEWTQMVPPERAALVRLLECTGDHAQAERLRDHIDDPREFPPGFAEALADATASLRELGIDFVDLRDGHPPTPAGRSSPPPARRPPMTTFPAGPSTRRTSRSARGRRRPRA